MPIIEVQYLHKQYGRKVAVEAIAVAEATRPDVILMGATGYLLKDAPRANSPCSN